MVATHAITPVEGLWVPSFVDLLWSLNAPYAKHRRSRGEDNLSQNGPSHHTQNISIPPTGSGS